MNKDRIVSTHHNLMTDSARLLHLTTTEWINLHRNDLFTIMNTIIQAVISLITDKYLWLVAEAGSYTAVLASDVDWHHSAMEVAISRYQTPRESSSLLLHRTAPHAQTPAPHHTTTWHSSYTSARENKPQIETQICEYFINNVTIRIGTVYTVCAQMSTKDIYNDTHIIITAIF